MSKQFSRRDFLKGAAAAGAGAMTMGLTACSPAAAGNSPSGAGTADNMVLSDQTYRNLKWNFEVMPEEYPIPEEKIIKTITHDIIIIGSGMSGLCTAVSTKESGADVRVISAGKRPISRGGSNHAIGSKKQKELGIDYTPDTASGRHAAKVEKHSAACYIDERKWSTWINNSGPAMDWMIDKMASKGLKVCLEPGYVDPDGILTVPAASHSFYNEEVPFGMLFGAPLCAQAYADIFKDMGGEIDFQTRALYLIRDDNNTGRVSAVVAQNLETGEYIKYSANRAVVLATGDFSKDPDMMAKYSPWAWNLYRNSIDTTKVDYDVALAFNGLYPGDGHKMGLWIGAGWQKTYPNAPMINCGAPGPKVNSIDNFWGINLTSDGKRYHNEVTNFSYGAIAILQLPDHIAYSVWDSRYAYIQDIWETFGCSVNNENGILGATPEQMIAGWEADVEAGTCWKANTIEELVDKMGFKGEARANAIESINNYTKYAEQGRDEEYHVNPSVLHPIKTPPFYAARTHFGKDAMTFLCVTGGLRTNEYMQVCEDDDTPIDGLFNTGIMVGDYYAGTYNFVMPGQNLGGVCNCLSYILGRRLADQNFKFRSGRIERVSTPEDESAQNDGSSMASLGGGDASYNDGVYTGTGSGGMGGDVKVEVTIENGKLASLTYTDNETPEIGGKALPELVEQAVSANAATVDSVSGATMTSTAFKAALADALTKAAK
ncbi:FAD-binding protein [Desulfitobacterium chlororespirans]|uniref:Urocanate reductase n=1 Tax=Desulfitobacterium chlororespirans DSM 11544 TaxID=1121395 RepID=A0A1M7TNH2_9FIRM|nr:FAD-binding protein [Desulfitobacterium chlororespirans]SHN72299.1 Tat (twin-arginine translocation) pathway signal sequence [Desulfitobacterium chlororespirans DSM 11544]